MPRLYSATNHGTTLMLFMVKMETELYVNLWYKNSHVEKIPDIMDTVCYTALSKLRMNSAFRS